MSATMIKEFRLPDLGEGLTESEIVSWKVGVGDTVTLNQVIAEVETAKAVVELPSPFAGVITALHEQPGTVVEVGKPIVSFEVPDDSGALPAGFAPAEAETPKRQPNLVGYGAVVESSGRPVRRQRNFAAQAAEPVESRTVETMPAEFRSFDRPRSTPPVRKLAKDLGVELAAVPGTGVQGLITRDDVRNFVGGGDVLGAARHLSAVSDAAAPADRTAAQGGREVRTPIKGVRKFTAAAMVASAFTAPHATEFLTVDVTPTMDLLAKLKRSRAFLDHKLTPLTLVAKTVLIALRRNPSLNSRWDEANQEIVQFNYVNLGIAAATPRGLTVPNIKDADTLSLLELSEALTDLTETARAGKTAPAELADGTISITNIGVFGIDAGTPILNPGEAAILAVGAVRKMPWEFQDEVALRQVMTLSLSFDHRLVDGEQGSRFLADVGAILADPGMVLTMV
ncbi:dihydrolipoamide acetyltransferase family protein [Pseudarthrobacter sulfonivorans]|uniref:dihydrolipoamide acetyltransferase family protein n=1 Tax=Pseudarthrobacter sulfonivorans TaxID=121292 RepID=UPI002860E5AC|nr:dihydrolipoamide acetyltransferase family protein [Pseudarthrobacter sulfonivorans]MDR6416240.1 pyruvate dehydrogenase E2 component (dihydrolipoamide acetyltransferase) [Pseudarthrobacter sulfonivorans]